MPFRPPRLDDRTYQDLLDEMIARIPAHTPEWTNPRPGDPGRTLLELFCWLADTILYRANAIPERQRLAFLRLLGVRMRPARPARCLVTIRSERLAAIRLRAGAKIKGPAEFESASEVTVLPVTAQPYYKRSDLSEAESELFNELKGGLQSIYHIDDPVAYVTTPVFENGMQDDGFDVVQNSVDGCLWLALLANEPDAVETVRGVLGAGGEQLINVGIVPAVDVADPLEDTSHLAPIRCIWELSSPDLADEPRYQTLDVISDTTRQLTKGGVLRLRLPVDAAIGSSSNNVREQLKAGVGDRPPRIDDEQAAARLVAWLRLRPDPDQPFPLESLRLSWIGVNALEAEQLVTVRGRVVGQSDGAADQEFRLHEESVDTDSLVLEIEEADLGFRRWVAVDDLALASRDAPAYQLDSEAGTVRFGDGLRGRIPDTGSRIRVALMRVGGGQRGNLPAGTLSGIQAVDLDNAPVTGLKLSQPVPSLGGEDAERIEEAERRVPAVVRHRHRAVTRDDYKQLAAETPGVRLGRVEVLPQFKPHQRRFGVAGTVATMVWPQKSITRSPNPRADRPLLESVHNYLDARRPITAELYVIGCEYVEIGVSASISVDDEFPRDQTVNEVREALYQHLWSLPPHGPAGRGWPLGKPVGDRELEVVAARVSGVKAVHGVNLFRLQHGRLQIVEREHQCAESSTPLEPWQLPELVAVQVVVDGSVPTEVDNLRNPAANDSATPVPVVPEVC